MKKNILLLTLVLTGLTACNNNSDTTFKIATSFAPLYDFTKRIVLDKAEVICVAGNNEVHDFQLNDPNTVAFIEDASLVFTFGHNIDNFMNIEDIKVNYNVTENVTFYDTNGQIASNNSTIDPHSWLSIKQGRIMLKNIYEKIASMDNENKDFYKANYEKADEEFKKLDEKYQALFIENNLKSNKIVTSHEAFAYLAKDYNLIQKGIADIADNEVTSSKITEMVNYIKDNDVHTIFVEELDSSKNVETIIDEVKKDSNFQDIKQEELSAYEGVDVKEYNNGDDYLSLMDSSLNKIYEALKK